MSDELTALVSNYKPSAEVIETVRDTQILLLVGISGAGKDTVSHQLFTQGGYHQIVSHTTRPPRENHGVMEKDGREYHFISLAQAEQMVRDHAFVEVKQYGKNLYGTSAAELQAAQNIGEIAVAVVEVQGVAEYKQIDSSITAVFLLPPDYATWQERLSKRYDGKIDEVDIRRRMQTAHDELRHALETDYFHFVVNDDIERTIATVDAIAKHKKIAETDEESRKIAQRIAHKLSGTLDL